MPTISHKRGKEEDLHKHSEFYKVAAFEDFDIERLFTAYNN